MVGEAYVETFNVIKSICNERTVLRDWFSKTLRPLNQKTNLRFLSIGAGSGDFDFTLIQDLLNAGITTVEYTAVEPSLIHANKIRSEARHYSTVTTNVINKTFEDTELKGEYDLILCMHSLYYMKDKEQTVLKALSHLAEGNGQLIAIHQASQGVAPVQKYFVRNLRLKTNPGMSAEDLLNVFDSVRSRVACEPAFSIVSTVIDLTDALNPSSTVGQSLFRFLLDVDPESLDKNIMEEFREYLRDMSYQHGSATHMLQPLGVFVVHRPKD